MKYINYMIIPGELVGNPATIPSSRKSLTVNGDPTLSTLDGALTLLGDSIGTSITCVMVSITTFSVVTLTTTGTIIGLTTTGAIIVTPFVAGGAICLAK